MMNVGERPSGTAALLHYVVSFFTAAVTQPRSNVILAPTNIDPHITAVAPA
jgi:hypothetical protein